MPNDSNDASRKLNTKRAAKQQRTALEELRRQQHAQERRRTIIVTTIVTLVGVLILSAVLVPSYFKNRNSPANKATSSFGVAASAANCGPDEKLDPEPGPEEVKAEEGDGLHLDDDERTRGKYQTWEYKNNPPASGPHLVTPMPGTFKFYEPGQLAQEPQMVERLVHNLEHGYVVVWYDETIAQDATKTKALEQLADNVNSKLKRPKYIAAPWPKDRPAMPDGKHVSMNAWHARQLCGDVSGEAIATFMKAHPPTDAPEPNAP